jgi:pimeloyl-ACP methyl ester carboxylesterase
MLKDVDGFLQREPGGEETSKNAQLAPHHARCSGTRVVVMLHQSDNGLCGWFGYAGYLAGRGFQVLLFDRRCTGNSSCPTGEKANRHAADVATAGTSTAARRRRPDDSDNPITEVQPCSAEPDPASSHWSDYPPAPATAGTPSTTPTTLIATQRSPPASPPSSTAT